MRNERDPDRFETESSDRTALCFQCIVRKRRSPLGGQESHLDPNCTISLFWFSYGYNLAVFPNREYLLGDWYHLLLVNRRFAMRLLRVYFLHRTVLCKWAHLCHLPILVSIIIYMQVSDQPN